MNGPGAWPSRWMEAYSFDSRFRAYERTSQHSERVAELVLEYHQCNAAQPTTREVC